MHLRVKTGTFASHFLDPSTIDSFFGLVEMHKDVEWQIYTSLPGSRLNGGRPNTFVREGDSFYDVDMFNHQKRGFIATLSEIEEKLKATIRRLNERGVGVSFALTNHQLEDEDLKDPFFLRVLDFMAQARARNDVTYLRSELASFLRGRYGNNLNLTASIIKFLSEPEFTYAHGLKEADDIVLMHMHNYDDAVLNSIVPGSRHRVFVICNTGCKKASIPYDCGRHYQDASWFNHSGQFMYPRCYFQDDENTAEITSERMAQLIDMGYTAFKMGRPGSLSDEKLKVIGRIIGSPVLPMENWQTPLERYK